MTLLEKTKNLLFNRNVNLTFEQIQSDTGLSKHWLKKLNQGKILNPSVNSIEKLHEYLEKLKAEQ